MRRDGKNVTEDNVLRQWVAGDRVPEKVARFGCSL